MEPDWKTDTAVCRATPPAPGFPGRVRGSHWWASALPSAPSSAAELPVSALRIFTSSVVLASTFLLQEDSPSSAGLEEKGFVVLEKMHSCVQTVVSSAEHIFSTLWNPWTLFFPATYVLWSLTPNSFRDVITVSETLLPIILPGSSPYSISPVSTFKYNLSSFFNNWTYASRVTLSDVLIILPEIITL